MTYDDHWYDDLRENGCGKHKRQCWCYSGPYGDEEFKADSENNLTCTCEVQDA